MANYTLFEALVLCKDHDCPKPHCQPNTTDADCCVMYCKAQVDSSGTVTCANTLTFASSRVQQFVVGICFASLAVLTGVVLIVRLRQSNSRKSSVIQMVLNMKRGAMFGLFLAAAFQSIYQLCFQPCLPIAGWYVGIWALGNSFYFMAYSYILLLLLRLSRLKSLYINRLRLIVLAVQVVYFLTSLGLALVCPLVNPDLSRLGHDGAMVLIATGVGLLLVFAIIAMWNFWHVAPTLNRASRTSLVESGSTRLNSVGSSLRSNASEGAADAMAVSSSAGAGRRRVLRFLIALSVCAAVLWLAIVIWLSEGGIEVGKHSGGVGLVYIFWACVFVAHGLTLLWLEPPRCFTKEESY